MKEQMTITFFALGTVNSITVSKAAEKTVVNRAMERVHELHEQLSAYSKHGDIAAINAAAGDRYIKVHKDTFHLVEQAKKFAELTIGAYDPSIFPLVKIWNQGRTENVVPEVQDICNAKCLVNYKDILLDSENCSVMLGRGYMALDLGGIAKGFAADEARRILTEGGITEAVINFGGTVIVMGMPRAVGIQHPGQSTGIPMGSVSLSGQAAVTSGSYEKSFIKDGKLYHHLIDPQTGRPAESNLVSVTLIGSSAMELDALSTAVFVLGIENGNELVEKFGLNAVYIKTDNKIFVTAGINDTFALQ